MKKNRDKNHFERLYALAESQQGFFTSKQAKEAGFADNTHPYHVHVGNWVRVYRGIYRLERFPRSDDEQLVQWYLWSRGRNEIPRGVYSHQTALSIYGLSDIMPSKLHMTVPPGFRRSSDIPKELILYTARLDSKDVEHMRGFAVTRPIKTIIDLALANTVSRDIIRQAIREGRQRGLISVSEIKTAQALSDLEPWLADLLRGDKK